MSDNAVQSYSGGGIQRKQKRHTHTHTHSFDGSAQNLRAMRPQFNQVALDVCCGSCSPSCTFQVSAVRSVHMSYLTPQTLDSEVNVPVDVGFLRFGDAVEGLDGCTA